MGLALGICLPFLAGYMFLILGGMPVPTKGNPLPFERMIASQAIRVAMRGAAQLQSPIEASQENLAAGGKTYKTNCAVCHGIPTQAESAVAKGMFPKPPQLFPPNEGVTRNPIGTTYWVVKNGIRMTGMPGFVEGLTDKELWQVSLLLNNADALPESVRAGLLR